MASGNDGPPDLHQRASEQQPVIDFQRSLSFQTAMAVKMAKVSWNSGGGPLNRRRRFFNRENTSMRSLKCFAIIGLIAVNTLLLACTSANVATPAPAPVIERGEEVFQRAAGEVGCASCHGIDARGTDGSSAPNILGRPAIAIERALARVAQMSFISLTDEDLDAVVAYLQFFKAQP